MAVLLEAHPLFAEADRERVRPVLRSVRVSRFEKGALLAGPGSGSADLYLVLEGLLYAYDLTPDGGRVLFEVIEAGGVDGMLGSLGLTPHFTEAGTAASVAILHAADLERLVSSEPAVARNLIRFLIARVSRREAQLHAAALKDPTRRLAKQLLALADVVGDGDGNRARLRVRLTHQQIADMLGIRRETATIHLHLLAAAGGVQLLARELHVNRERLRAIVEGRYTAPAQQRPPEVEKRAV